jgi:hypothetical protein
MDQIRKKKLHSKQACSETERVLQDNQPCALLLLIF